MPAPPTAHGGAAGGDLCQGLGRANQVLGATRLRIDSPEGRQHYSLRIGTVEPVLGSTLHNKRLNRFTLQEVQGEHAVAAALPSAQHREAGRVRAKEIVGRMGLLFGARMSATGLIERADPPQRTSGGGQAMVTNIAATLSQRLELGFLHSLFSIHGGGEPNRQ